MTFPIPRKIRGKKEGSKKGGREGKGTENRMVRISNTL